MKKSIRAVGLFFLLLFFGLFLGDGKQGVVEVYGVAIVVILYWLLRLERHIVKPLPKLISVSWMLYLFVAVVSAGTSDSVGLSVSSLARFVSGYLACLIFYNISREKTSIWFTRLLLWFVFFACVTAFILKQYPSLLASIPSMNLLTFTYGHNHLADILVIAGPLVLGAALMHKKWEGKVMAIVYLVALLSTYARGAWFIVGVYFLYEIFRWVKDAKRNVFTVNNASVLIALLAVVIFFCVNTPSVRSSILGRRQSFSIRLEYWRQALVAFKEKPAFGRGPGSFSLSSLRLQSTPMSSSWFAHSMPMQVVSETGLLGLVAFVCVLICVAQILTQRPKMQTEHGERYRRLRDGALLLLIYSLVEFSLDYFLVWQLFWASVGFLLAHSSVDEPDSSYVSWFTSACLGFLLLFYFLWVSSVMFTMVKRYDLAFYFAPFDTITTMVYLENTPSVYRSQLSVRAAEFFHRNNPEVLETLSDSFHRAGDDVASLQYLSRAAHLNAYNIPTQKKLLELLVKQKENRAYFNETSLLCEKYDVSSMFSCALDFSIEDQIAVGARMIDLHDDMASVSGQSLGTQRLLYLSGLAIVQSKPDLTRKLWFSAIAIDPNWGYFPVELASLEHWVLGDSKAAENTLRLCGKNIYTGDWCRDYLKDLNLLPSVGSLSPNIQAIPKILSTQK